MLYNILRSPAAAPQQLHIPDGFLSAPVAILAWIVTIAFIVVAVRRASREFDERLVPLMGVLAAFIFAAQAFNFPVAGGTSGHFLGGALAAILLGPWPALLVMAAVVGLQGLIFQDGGLLAMGANIFVMGIVTVWAGYFIYHALQRLNRYVAAFAAGWLSVVLAASPPREVSVRTTFPAESVMVSSTASRPLSPTLSLLLSSTKWNNPVRWTVNCPLVSGCAWSRWLSTNVFSRVAFAPKSMPRK